MPTPTYKSATPPNVLLVIVDQLAAKWLEAAFDGAAPLPNLEWLRDSGTMFRNAFTPNPVCSPARASLATGLPSSAHGVVECGYRLDPAIPTFMGELQRAGWRTSLHGKLHFQPNLETFYPDYRQYGFDHTDVTEDVRVGPWLDWVRETHPLHYPAALATVWMTMHPALRSEPFSGLREDIEKVQRAWRWASDERPLDSAESYALPFPAEISQSAWITDRAVERITAHSGGEPMFAQVGYIQPHNPFCAPEELLRLVNEAAIPAPVPAEWASDPNAPTIFSSAKRGPCATYDEAGRNARQIYFADLIHLDQQFGRLRQALVDSGRLHDTYLIFTSDHGELLYDHGLLGKWNRHYDACIRVPLLIAGPGIAAGAVEDSLVELTDLAPTILDLCGVAEPRLPRFEAADASVRWDLRALHGRSLGRIGSVEHPAPRRESVLVESYGTHWNSDADGFARTLRTARHRYTVYGDGSEQLFDLQVDPDEQDNLVGRAGTESLRTGLSRQLLQALITRDNPPPGAGLYARQGW
ncbi:sulfatase-like hydrolase/transferase [Dactylosporangium sp. NPDC000244]|uniref:sulfatase family protein n=1 Tax=Dactylosporangium sp. NPDC000244 TaxID=3154365 RepID=UPI00331CE36D